MESFPNNYKRLRNGRFANGPPIIDLFRQNKPIEPQAFHAIKPILMVWRSEPEYEEECISTRAMIEFAKVGVSFLCKLCVLLFELTLLSEHKRTQSFQFACIAHAVQLCDDQVF